jgi:hypothetical protein
MVTKKLRPVNYTNESFGKNWRAKNCGNLLRILQNVIEKSFINWRVLPLVKINTRISDTPVFTWEFLIKHSQ